MKRRSDEEISAPLYEYDAAVRAQYGCFAGVDEAGRGPLCGPVCVAACILDPENPVQGINDSKKLTEKKRDALFDEIKEKALAYRIVFVGPDIIDRDNILNATMGGMKQAVEELDIVPNLVLVDGNRVPAGLQIPAQPVVVIVAAEKLHVDPAVMASPLITTIVDATTLLIYFNVAKIVLHL